MDIDPTQRTQTGSAPQSADHQAPNSELDRDAFMRLLVTQIRNQDPVDPMDTQEMMTQLSQLSSVEHLIGIEERLASLQIASAGMANAQAASFGGQRVRADAAALRLPEAGMAQGAFSLSEGAQVSVTIRNERGEAVRTESLDALPPGEHAFAWNGRDDEGNRLSPGAYRMSVSATDAEGHPVEARTEIEGIVQSIAYDQGFPELVIGAHRVRMGDVREVSRAAPIEVAR